MLYTNPQGKKFNIPDDYLSKQMQNLGVSKMEAVQLWLEDNGVEKTKNWKLLTRRLKRQRFSMEPVIRSARAQQEKENLISKNKILLRPWLLFSQMIILQTA